MEYSSRRGMEELKSIEKQLPLFYSKINNLEKRQKELKMLLAESDVAVEKERDMDIRGASRAPAAGRVSLMQKPAGAPNESAVKKDAGKSESFRVLDLLQKDKVMGVLGEANGQLKVLNNVVTKAVSTVESILMIVDFLEKNGQDLQRLIEMANLIGVSNVDGGKTGGSNGTSINPDMISEMMKSPQFTQLVTQVLSNLKPAEGAPEDKAAPEESPEPEQPEVEPLPRQGAFFGPPGWGPWGPMKRADNR